MTRAVKRIGFTLRQSNGVIILPEWCREDLVNLHVPSEAELHTADAVQKYPLGAKVIKADSIWRYVRVGETIAVGSAGFLNCNRIRCPGLAGNSVHEGYEGSPNAAVVAGDSTIYITDTAALVHEYEGAHVSVYDYGSSPAYFDSYYVVDNDVSNGTRTTLYLAEGVKNAWAITGVTLDVYLSPYYSVGSLNLSGNQSWKSAIGKIGLAPCTSGYFYWMKTAGLCHGTLSSTECGKTAFYRDVYSNTDGSLIHYTAGYQRVGYLLWGTSAAYGDQTYMLQLEN